MKTPSDTLRIAATAAFLSLAILSCGPAKKTTSAATGTGPATVTSQAPASITFTVDGPLEVLDHYKYPSSPQRVYSRALEQLGIDDQGHRLVGASFGKDEIGGSFNNAGFNMFIRAYAGHHPLVLDPDFIWMLVCQNFSYWVNTHSEELKDKIVADDAGSTIQVQSSTNLLAPDADYSALLEEFSKKIGSSTKGGLAATLVADFSTTGPVQKAASQITLMDATKSYFEYVAVWASCGIPYITLKGTPDDWRSVVAKAKSLRGYGIDDWVGELVPVLEEFVKAAEGNPSRNFWRSIVSRQNLDVINGPRCSPGAPPQTTFDGWFLTLFPFGPDGRTPDAVTSLYSAIPEIVRVPLLYKIVLPDGRTISEHDLELLAGIVGFSEDEATGALSPQIGWLVGEVTPVPPIQL